MSQNNQITVVESREWVRNGRTLLKISGNKVEIPAMGLCDEEQAAVCFVLLTRLQDRLGIAPFACDGLAIEKVADALSSIAEFPEQNPV